MRCRPAARAVIVTAYLAFIVVSSAFAQTRSDPRLPAQVIADAHAWLSALIPQGKGPCDFVFVMFTGNMARDPDHAEAQRRLLSAWMNTTLRPGDTVRIGAGEHGLWALSDPVEITLEPEPRRAAFSGLPAGPAPGSQGGKNIEAVLAETGAGISLADERSAVIVMLSNGWSQDAGTGSTASRVRAGEGVSPTAALEQLGFGGFHREAFGVPTSRATRQVLVTACVRPAANPAELPARDYRQALSGWVPEAYAPASPPPENAPAEPTPYMPMLTLLLAVAAIVLSAAGFVAVRRSRSGAVPAPTAAPLPDAPSPLVEHLPQLEAAITDARRQADSLKLMRDTLQDLIGQLGAQKPSGSSEDADPPGVAELGRLRTALASVEQDLADWDTTAIAYLEAAEAVIRNPAVDERHRRAWLKAANDFCRLAQRHGFSRISPEPGDPYIPGLHMAVAVEGDPTRAGSVAECLRWGYQNGARVYRLAEVRLADTHTDSNKGDADASASGH